ncbi:hypothetical protein C9374_001309 [Naegleria lovaniensis]|uniref:Isopropylmalate dehydrogenase-like domain-containing protein n=1 Tax=Naegleria lovaniensis TaxID=51637 RepID=A0AA88KLC0_NAELO|nr:uncharacterized protein C9374_001309 [Naegleria lovaniensis]KAG2387715.1 hypothetical protein C9374_001309 [Naegleria lovaniensis]
MFKSIASSSSVANSLFSLIGKQQHQMRYIQKVIGVIPADGIGKEVVPAAIQVMNAAIAKSVAAKQQDFSLKYIPLEAGWETFEKSGKSLPSETVEALKTKCDGAIFGSVQSPSHKVEGYSSPIVAMRKLVDLYANIRPCQDVKKGIDMLIVRENTECLYIKKEKLSVDPQSGEKIAIAERLITERASKRIAEMAFKLAIQRNKKNSPKVTIVHKSNVLSVSDGLFRESCLQVAKKYPQVKVEEQLVDSMVYKMILDPTQYDVVVAPNLYGDILSDAASAFVGGLGVTGSANMGDSFALVEPVHGSAPDIYGKGIANPIATIRACAMLLRFLQEHDPVHCSFLNPIADQMEKAVDVVMNDQSVITPDLGGKGNTETLVNAIIKNL